jgi:uncharacterized membrane protein
MKSSVKYLMAGMICIGLFSCYYDNQEELHPGGNTACDTSDVTYAGKVTQILQRNCINCHSQNLASGNVALDSYSGIKAAADNGSLLGSIEHTPGFAKMPQNLPQLSSCDRTIIKMWIENGTPND